MPFDSCPIATAMTVASVVAPSWISFSVTPKAGDAVFDRFGLRQRCTSTSSAGDKCGPFPDSLRCDRDGASFWYVWFTLRVLPAYFTLSPLDLSLRISSRSLA